MEPVENCDSGYVIPGYAPHGRGPELCPRFLAYADKPTQSDAVILFLGSDAARKKEANRLLDEGYARFLIVPGFHQVFRPGNIPLQARPSRNGKSRGPGGYPGFYENTHIEVLYAKEMMDALGLKSAIMVSSAYHMRRIRMISGKVFGAQSRHFSYVPTRYESNPTVPLKMTRADLAAVFREYVKIGWFQLYSLLGDRKLEHILA